MPRKRSRTSSPQPSSSSSSACASASAASSAAAAGTANSSEEQKASASLPLVQIHEDNPKPKKSAKTQDGKGYGRNNEDIDEDEGKQSDDENALMEDEFDVLAQEAGKKHQEVPKSAQPTEMTTPLLPFQLESLYWMKKQEYSAYRGGILADEMGMGKTLQAIGLILDHRHDSLPLEPLFSPPNHESEGVRKERQRRHDEANKQKKKKMREKLRDARREVRKQEKAQLQKAKKSRKSATEAKIPFPERKSDEQIMEELSDEEVGVEPVEVPPQVLPEKTVYQNDVISGGVMLPKPTDGVCKTTLVVCPVVALNQWKLEIERHTTPNSLKVLVYHGSSRCSSIDTLKSYDVVLTTYSIIESEFRRMIEPTKKKCEYCGRRLLPERMTIHLRYFCGPDAVRTEKLALTERRTARVARRFARQTHRQLQSAVNERDEESSSSEDDEDVEPTKGKKATTASLAKKNNPVSQKSAANEKESSANGNEDLLKGKASSAKKASGKSGKKQSAKTTAKSKHSKDSESEFSGSSDSDDVDYSEDQDTPTPTTRTEKTEKKEGIDDNGTEEGKEGKEENDKKYPKLGPISLLQSVFWKRIILDEAHAIKNRRSTTAKAAFALTAERRWCLSGTPLQNRVGELYSLVRFLRIDPFAYYFCRNCPCKTLDYKFGSNWKSCDECGHSPLRHYCWWNRFISNPIRFGGGEEKVEKALNILRQDVLVHILLRRTKASRTAELSLPPKVTTIRCSPMDPFEKDFYEALYTQSQAKFNTYVQSGTVLHNYAHIFDLLVRLRQAVDHPYLVLYSSSGTKEQNDSASSGDTASTVGPCGICNEPCEDPVLTSCYHAFCRSCMRDFLSSFDLASGQLQCPKCFAPLTIDLRGDDPTQSLKTAEESTVNDEPEMPTSPVVRQEAQSVNDRHTASLAAINAGADRVSDAYLSALGVLKTKSMLARLPPERIGKGFRSSSKIEALLQELYRARLTDPGGKSLVFSQFTNMLDLIQHRLAMAGVQAVRLDGRMSVKQRDRMVHAFMTDPDVTVFLVSLKAGGLALNLTAAHRIYLMDPWWNPAAEYQALDRTHRLGQYRPINAVRFMIEDSIEERIIALQEKKRLIFEGTIGQNEGELSKLTEKDMKFLFSRA